MSTEMLRQAAALMRERARCTSAQGEWTFLIGEEGDGDLWGIVRAGEGESRRTVAESDYANDAGHIAAWHPIVALAVADWLDDTATANERLAPVAPERDMTNKKALAVARAYLGGVA